MAPGKGLNPSQKNYRDSQASCSYFNKDPSHGKLPRVLHHICRQAAQGGKAVNFYLAFVNFIGFNMVTLHTFQYNTF